MRRRSKYNLPATLHVSFIVSSGGLTKELLGSGTGNPTKDLDFMLRKAENQARYRFFMLVGMTPEFSTIQDFYFDYGRVKRLGIRIKRENWKGSYFNVARDSKGRFVSSERYRVVKRI